MWHGWGWTPTKREQFEERKVHIFDAVQKQLAVFRIFVADIGIEPRFLERFEAAIMDNLYQQPPPMSDIPDKGMMLAPRWASEQSISVTNKCDFLLYGIPQHLEI